MSTFGNNGSAIIFTITDTGQFRASKLNKIFTTKDHPKCKPFSIIQITVKLSKIGLTIIRTFNSAQLWPILDVDDVCPILSTCKQEYVGIFM